MSNCYLTSEENEKVFPNSIFIMECIYVKSRDYTVSKMKVRFSGVKLSIIWTEAMVIECHHAKWEIIVFLFCSFFNVHFYN